MDQGRGLEGLARLLLSEPLGGQLAQLVVDQRQELLGRLGVALLDGREDAGDVVIEVDTRVRPARAPGPVPWLWGCPIRADLGASGSQPA